MQRLHVHAHAALATRPLPLVPPRLPRQKIVVANPLPPVRLQPLEVAHGERHRRLQQCRRSAAVKPARCAGCQRELPAQGSSSTVDILGRLYPVCEEKCEHTLRARLAAALPPPPVQRVTASPTTSASGSAKSANHTTAAGGPAAPLTNNVARLTGLTGRRAPLAKISSTGRPAIAYCRNNADQAPECHLAQCPCCDGHGVAMVCPGCDGRGWLMVHSKRNAELAHTPQTIVCEPCRGRGFIPVREDVLVRYGFRKPPSGSREWNS